MIYVALNKNQRWRVVADYTASGGEVIDVCGAISEAVAQETAAAMNAALAFRRAR